MRADNPNVAPMSDPWLEPDDDPDRWCDGCDSYMDDCFCDDEDDNDQS